MNFSDKLKLWPNKQSLCFLVLTLRWWAEAKLVPVSALLAGSRWPVHLFSVWWSETLNVKKDLEKNAEIREGQSISQSLLPFKVSPCSSFGLNSQNLFMFPLLSTSPVTLDRAKTFSAWQEAVQAQSLSSQDAWWNKAMKMSGTQRCTNRTKLKAPVWVFTHKQQNMICTFLYFIRRNGVKTNNNNINNNRLNTNNWNKWKWVLHNTIFTIIRSF